jgi:hypothetical protein
MGRTCLRRLICRSHCRHGLRVVGVDTGHAGERAEARIFGDGAHHRSGAKADAEAEQGRVRQPVIGQKPGLVVSQAGRVIGSGRYTPICDAARHTFSVRVEANDGRLYEPEIAQALTFADIEWQGEIFSGIDDDGALELAP